MLDKYFDFRFCYLMQNQYSGWIGTKYAIHDNNPERCDQNDLH